MAHSETPVKVNVWVDEGVAPLVEALSAWDEVVTLDSCEAGPNALAYVQFTAEPPSHVVAVAECLADYLSQVDDCPAVISVEWSYGGELPMAMIACDRREVSRLSDLLVSAHKMGFSGDKVCTGTHNSRARPNHPSTQR